MLTYARTLFLSHQNSFCWNSIKFTNEGSITIRVDAEPALTPGAPPRVFFRVVDTGCGMDADAQAKLFQPYEMAHPSRIGKYGGSGLGLNICQALAKLLGGTIHCISSPGMGTTFVLQLQMEVATEVEGLEHAGAAAAGGRLAALGGDEGGGGAAQQAQQQQEQRRSEYGVYGSRSSAGAAATAAWAAQTHAAAQATVQAQAAAAQAAAAAAQAAQAAQAGHWPPPFAPHHPLASRASSGGGSPAAMRLDAALARVAAAAAAAAPWQMRVVRELIDDAEVAVLAELSAGGHIRQAWGAAPRAIGSSIGAVLAAATADAVHNASLLFAPPPPGAIGFSGGGISGGDASALLRPGSAGLGGPGEMQSAGMQPHTAPMPVPMPAPYGGGLGGPHEPAATPAPPARTLSATRGFVGADRFESPPPCLHAPGLGAAGSSSNTIAAQAGGSASAASLSRFASQASLISRPPSPAGGMPSSRASFGGMPPLSAAAAVAAAAAQPNAAGGRALFAGGMPLPSMARSASTSSLERNIAGTGSGNLSSLVASSSSACIAAMTPAPGQLRRVLAVDDEPVNLRLVKRFLEKERIEVVMGEDGHDLVDIMVKRGERFDVVLLDEHMRRMNGSPAAVLLRKCVAFACCAVCGACGACGACVR
jgi:CheY-like chemotaxis protein